MRTGKEIQTVSVVRILKEFLSTSQNKKKEIWRENVFHKSEFIEVGIIDYITDLTFMNYFQTYLNNYDIHYLKPVEFLSENLFLWV